MTAFFDFFFWFGVFCIVLFCSFFFLWFINEAILGGHGAEDVSGSDLDRGRDSDRDKDQLILVAWRAQACGFS